LRCLNKISHEIKHLENTNGIYKNEKMNKIGPGIAKIHLKTRAAGISACTSTYVYGAVILL
jgi:hypothetical protein